MVPAESQQAGAGVKLDQNPINADYILDVVRMARGNLITEQGKLVKNGKVVADSSIIDIISKGANAKHFNVFLELKAELLKKPEKRPLRQPASAAPKYYKRASSSNVSANLYSLRQHDGSYS